MIIKFITIILLNINNIDEINRLTKEAEIYFKNEEYNKSITNYKILIDSFDVTNEKIYLNLAHSHFLSNDTAKALENYTFAAITDNKKIKSIALQQIGNINESRNKLEEAIDFYKESIISDNTNIDSKFNYELVKKKIQKQKENKQEKPNEQNDKENKKENSENKKNDEKGNKDQQEKEKNESHEDKNEQKNSEDSDNESLEEKLKKINMSKKKAEMILNALNNNEFQYIQQLKRKPNKKKDSTKPDW
ncbi:MAG: hypothetical protein CBE50_000950 [Flammeovirgaceae bacterium TMED290]|nr:MAG: hypothetical protein CBE50_000950 [Flammeovirgaceae bacterium TMED290]|tara:strand:- start:12817 stop:13560 length:744 start_codon:yes stop_codon:yes gene_type:complete